MANKPAVLAGIYQPLLTALFYSQKVPNRDLKQTPAQPYSNVQVAGCDKWWGR